MTEYSWPTVVRGDGAYRCEVAYCNERHDVMVLRSVAQLKDAGQEKIPNYPTFSKETLFLGQSIGFISLLRLYETLEKSKTHFHFTSGNVSIFLAEGDEKVVFALTGCVVQPGCSGSAAFRPDGTIVGVVVQNLSFRADVQNPESPIHTLPCVSPISPLIEEINAAIANGKVS